MADEIDNVQEVEQRLLDERFKAQTAKRQPLPTSTECEACGEDIEPKRRAILPYTTLCAGCATVIELRNKIR